MARHTKKRRITRGSGKPGSKHTSSRRYDIATSWEAHLLRKITKPSQ